MTSNSPTTAEPTANGKCAAPAIPDTGSSNVTTDEAVRIVNAAIQAVKPGPEKYIAVAPGTVDVWWEDCMDGMEIPVKDWAKVDAKVAEQRRSNRNWRIVRGLDNKMDAVCGRVHGELKPRLHQLPEVWIVNVTHGIAKQVHGWEDGMLHPASARRLRAATK